MKAFRVCPVVALYQLALKAGATVLYPEHLIGRVRLTVASNPVDPKLSAIRVDEQPDP